MIESDPPEYPQAKNAFLQERSRLARKLQKENDEMEAAVKNLSPKVVHNTLLRSATSIPSSSDVDPEGSGKVRNTLAMLQLDQI